MDMILATDVQYSCDAAAVAAGVLFENWDSAVVLHAETVRIGQVSPYVPGRFFERELPCLLALVEAFGTRPGAIIVDGYVTLGPERRDGLGAYLFQALNGRIPVVGVAKNRFAGTPAECEVLRGRSKQPLFVTRMGIDAKEARVLVRSMHGAFRVPTMLREADRLCRAGVQKT
jgi:deoxyribonuclease V